MALQKRIKLNLSDPMFRKEPWTVFRDLREQGAIADPTKHFSAEDIDRTPVGCECEVKLVDDRMMKGTVESVNSGTLILKGVEEFTGRTSEQGVPMLNNIPYVNRLFQPSLQKHRRCLQFSLSQLRDAFVV